MDAMTATLVKPAADEVRAACAQYDREHGLAEQALDALVRQYPHNTDAPQVLVKVAAVNALCHTHVFHLEAVARHIVDEVPELDVALAAGSPEAVAQIARLAIYGRKYNLYSFATKYCARHNAAAYPVYDQRVEHYLCELQKTRPFAAFSHADMCDYPKFLALIDTFRGAFGLKSFSFAEIGKFLLLQGEPPVLPLQEEVQTGPGTFDFYPAQEAAS
jgi:hypothetical protein